MSGHDPDRQVAHEAADALADALSGKGFITQLHNLSGHVNFPCVEVSTARWQLVDITEYIYVARNQQNLWWFWWSSLGPIAPATEVSEAAETIARALAGIRFAGVRVL
jgi:hypothetical protein